MINLISLQSKNFSYIIYALMSTQNIIFSALKLDKEENNITPDDINEIFYSISDNSKKIKKLLKRKNSIEKEIVSLMDISLYSKQKLTNKQIKYYKEYSESLQYDGSFLKINLKAVMDDDYFKNIINQILLNEGDYSKIYKELKEIADYQYNALFCLNRIILKGNKFIKRFTVFKL